MLPQMKTAQPVSMDGDKATYSACVADYTPYALATDIVVLAGVSGKAIILNSVTLTGNATAATQFGMYLYKRSTLNTGGSFTRTPIAVHDSTDPDPSATVRQYSVIPSALGAGALLRSDHMGVPSASGTAAASFNIIAWNFGQGVAKCPKLLGPLESFAINCNGATVPGGFNLHITLQWTEE